MTAITSDAAPRARTELPGRALLRLAHRAILRWQAAAAFDCIEERLRVDAGLSRRTYLTAIE